MIPFLLAFNRILHTFVNSLNAWLTFKLFLCFEMFAIDHRVTVLGKASKNSFRIGFEQIDFRFSLSFFFLLTENKFFDTCFVTAVDLMFTQKKRSPQNAKNRLGWDLFYTIAVIRNDDGLSLSHQANTTFYRCACWKHRFRFDLFFSLSLWFFFLSFVFIFVISFKIYYCDLNTKCTANNFPLFWPASK